MIRTLLVTASLAVGGCHPAINQGIDVPVDTPVVRVGVPPTLPAPLPTPKPACTPHGIVVLYNDWDDPINCDVSPPMVLSFRIDETVEDYNQCGDWGGYIFHDDEVPVTYCMDVDY